MVKDNAVCQSTHADDGMAEATRLLLSPRAKPIAEFRSSRSSPIIFATTATGDTDGDGNLNALRGSH
jgi:hypothetical protein